jgi:mRNA interferase MazF
LRRGEIWTASGGSDYAGKPRPVLIVQEDSFAESASITVCLLTRTRIESEVGRRLVEPSPENGLRETSYVMVDKITTVPRERLGRRIGALKADEMTAIGRAMIVFLGLAG